VLVIEGFTHRYRIRARDVFYANVQRFARSQQTALFVRYHVGDHELTIAIRSQPRDLCALRTAVGA
jgi:hypothetical protein